MKNLNKCCLCSQIQGDSEDDLISELLKEEKYIKRIPIENNHFAVIPSLGALVHGHVLLCPKIHFKSFAQMDISLSLDFLNFKNQLKQVLEQTYHSSVHCFEHGSPRDKSKVLCTVDHAHLHLLPTNVEVLDTLLKVSDWVEIDESLESLRTIVGDNEYLYYQSPTNRTFVATNIEGFESQFMRKVFANALNKPQDWNWREIPNPSIADEIYKLINNEFGLVFH